MITRTCPRFCTFPSLFSNPHTHLVRWRLLSTCHRSRLCCKVHSPRPHHSTTAGAATPPSQTSREARRHTQRSLHHPWLARDLVIQGSKAVSEGFLYVYMAEEHAWMGMPLRLPLAPALACWTWRRRSPGSASGTAHRHGGSTVTGPARSNYRTILTVFLERVPSQLVEPDEMSVPNKEKAHALHSLGHSTAWQAASCSTHFKRLAGGRKARLQQKN